VLTGAAFLGVMGPQLQGVSEWFFLGAFAAAYVVSMWSIVRRFGTRTLLPGWLGAALLLSTLTMGSLWVRWPGLTEEGWIPIVPMLASVVGWALASLGPVTLLLRRRLLKTPVNKPPLAFVGLSVAIFLGCGAVIGVGLLWASLSGF
jgi:hypothetical protein